MIIALGMLVFGVNFNLFYLILLRKAKAAFADEELKWYLVILLAAVALIALNVAPLYDDVSRLLRDVFFTVSSTLTTTGYVTVNFDTWPVFSHLLLLLLTFAGAMGGSTAGGMKISRLVLYAKSARAELKRQREPGRIVPVMFNQRPITREAQRALFGYLAVYLSMFVALLIIVSLEVPDFVSAFSAVSATINNIGLGLNVVGPTGSYAQFNQHAKLILAFSMIAGRLEMWPVIILLSKRTWKKV